MKKIIGAIVGAACLLCSVSANAALYRLDFTATDFYWPFTDERAPQEQVRGSIHFTADALGAPITSINKVDLVIAGQKFLASDIASSVHSRGPVYEFGGNSCGLYCMSGNTNDLFLSVGWDIDFFQYAVVSNPYIWMSENVKASITEQAAEVPEPGSLALVLAGAAAAGLRRRRKQ